MVAVKCFVEAVGSSGGVRGQSAAPHPESVLFMCVQTKLAGCLRHPGNVAAGQPRR